MSDALAPDLSITARGLYTAIVAGRHTTRPSELPGGLGIEGAYEVARAMRGYRLSDGARLAGRKLGFTNPAAMAAFGVDGPMIGDLFDRTLVDGRSGAEVSLARLCEPRIEPEIVLVLDQPVAPDADEGTIRRAVGAVALGFEIVQSVYPGWTFTAADAIAASALHGCLVTGARVGLDHHDFDRLLDELASLEVILQRNGEEVATGIGGNALGGPLAALESLVRFTGDHPGLGTLNADEVITTGTLTDPQPVAAGEEWTVRTEDGVLPALTVTLTR